MDDIKTIFDLGLLEGGTEFRKELRGMNDEFVFSIPLLFSNTKGTYVQ